VQPSTVRATDRYRKASDVDTAVLPPRPSARRSRAAVGVLLLVAVTAIVRLEPASGAVFPVTTTADGGPGSLRDAIALAGAGAEPNVIELDAGATYLLDDCAAGDLDHIGSQPLTIEGHGATIRQTCPGERVLETDGDLTVHDATITGGDLMAGIGGGIEADTDSVTLVRSTVTGNRGPIGGGVAAIHVTLVDSTVSGNTAGSTGGGVWADQTVTATNSTITANAAGSAGGGLVLVNTTITLLHTTVAANTAPVGSNVQIQPGGDALISFASVVGTPQGGTGCDLAPGAVTTSQGANFSSDTSCGFGAGADDVDGGGDPLLGALGPNGGPTHTMLPAAGSPLVDRVNCDSAPTAVPADQRSVARPQGSRCDTGAVEVEVVPPTTTAVPTPGPTPAPPARPLPAHPRFTG
jgi:hypothetical protein